MSDVDKEERERQGYFDNTEPNWGSIIIASVIACIGIFSFVYFFLDTMK